MKPLLIRDWSGDTLAIHEPTEDAPSEVIAEIETVYDLIGIDVHQAIAIRDWLTKVIERKPLS